MDRAILDNDRRHTDFGIRDGDATSRTRQSPKGPEGQDASTGVEQPPLARQASDLFSTAPPRRALPAIRSQVTTKISPAINHLPGPHHHTSASNRTKKVVTRLIALPLCIRKGLRVRLIALARRPIAATGSDLSVISSPPRPGRNVFDDFDGIGFVFRPRAAFTSSNFGEMPSRFSQNKPVGFAASTASCSVSSHEWKPICVTAQPSQVRR